MQISAHNTTYDLDDAELGGNVGSLIVGGEAHVGLLLTIRPGEQTKQQMII